MRGTNRLRRWRDELVWARKLPLRGRLMWNRNRKFRREFLPLKPIWRRRRVWLP